MVCIVVDTSQQGVHVPHANDLALMTLLQAEEMSRRMNDISDKQLEMLLKGASWLQSGLSLLQQARARILANKLLVLGILLLLLAVVLRHFNIL